MASEIQNKPTYFLFAPKLSKDGYWHTPYLVTERDLRKDVVDPLVPVFTNYEPWFGDYGDADEAYDSFARACHEIADSTVVDVRDQHSNAFDIDTPIFDYSIGSMVVCARFGRDRVVFLTDERDKDAAFIVVWKHLEKILMEFPWGGGLWDNYGLFTGTNPNWNYWGFGPDRQDEPHNFGHETPTVDTVLGTIEQVIAQRVAEEVARLEWEYDERLFRQMNQYNDDLTEALTPVLTLVWIHGNGHEVVIREHRNLLGLLAGMDDIATSMGAIDPYGQLELRSGYGKDTIYSPTVLAYCRPEDDHILNLVSQRDAML